MKKLFAISSIALLTSTAFAAEAGKTETGLDYNELNASYVSSDFDGTTFAGYDINVTYLLTENIFVGGDYSSLDKSSVNISRTTGLVGYRMPLAPTIDGFATLGYTYGKVTSSTAEDMFPMSVGVRAAITPELDVRASVSYIEGNDAQTGFSGLLKYKFNNNMFVTGGYSYYKGDTATTSYTLGVGIKF
jgi:hypothetical protein